MKRIRDNKEFELMIANLLCAEEHVVDMLSTCDEKDRKKIVGFLKNLKEERNKILDFPEQKDKNKWCVVKHLLLAKYHSLEMMNDQKNKEYNNLINLYNNISSLINKFIDNDLDVKCNVCVEDLMLFKFFKKN